MEERGPSPCISIYSCKMAEGEKELVGGINKGMRPQG